MEDNSNVDEVGTKQEELPHTITVPLIFYKGKIGDSIKFSRFGNLLEIIIYQHVYKGADRFL